MPEPAELRPRCATSERKLASAPRAFHLVSLTTEGFVSWEFASSLDAGQRAALETGKAVLHVCPPAGWTLVPLAAALPAPSGGGLRLLVAAAEESVARDVASALDTLPALGPLHLASGLARSDRLLRAGAIRTLVGTTSDLLELTRRAALKLDAVTHVLVCWPEAHLALQRGEALDTLLSEARGAARLIATADEEAIAAFVERHAWRAPLGVAARRPEAPLGAARAAVIPRARRAAAVREALDQLDPADALLWEPLPARLARWEETVRVPGLRVTSALGDDRAALAIAVDLPTPAAFAALRAAADDLLVLLEAHQLPTLQSLTTALRPIRLRGDVDRARDRAFQRRWRVRERLEQGGLDAELLALAPLFEEYDAALVAAAALATAGPAPEAAAPDTVEEIPAWTRIHLSVGRRDGVRPGDVVGALLNSVGLARDRVGRVDIRDTFTLVEVRAEEVPTALRGLGGVRLKNRPVAARLDRR